MLEKEIFSADPKPPNEIPKSKAEDEELITTLEKKIFDDGPKEIPLPKPREKMVILDK
jgi:hypothetical protein